MAYFWHHAATYILTGTRKQEEDTRRNSKCGGWPDGMIVCWPLLHDLRLYDFQKLQAKMMTVMPLIQEIQSGVMEKYGFASPMEAMSAMQEHKSDPVISR
jgi:hypothetical protein